MGLLHTKRARKFHVKEMVVRYKKTWHICKPMSDLRLLKCMRKYNGTEWSKKTLV
jgi:hypothetical protein